MKNYFLNKKIVESNGTMTWIAGLICWHQFTHVYFFSFSIEFFYSQFIHQLFFMFAIKKTCWISSHNLMLYHLPPFKKIFFLRFSWSHFFKKLIHLLSLFCCFIKIKPSYLIIYIFNLNHRFFFYDTFIVPTS